MGLDNMQNVVQFLLAVFLGELIVVNNQLLKFSKLVSMRALTVLESPPSPNSGKQVNLHASTN